MPFISWINEIFPAAQEPFTMGEIVTRLQRLYSPHVSRTCAYRAMWALRDSPLTASVVRREKIGKTLYFNADAARLIARRVTRSKPPVRLGFDEQGNYISARNPRQKKKLVPKRYARASGRPPSLAQGPRVIGR